MAVVRAARAAAHQAPRYARLGGQCSRGRCVTASLNRARRLRRNVGVDAWVGRVYTIRGGYIPPGGCAGGRWFTPTGASCFPDQAHSVLRIVRASTYIRLLYNSYGIDAYSVLAFSQDNKPGVWRNDATCLCSPGRDSNYSNYSTNRTDHVQIIYPHLMI